MKNRASFSRHDTAYFFHNFGISLREFVRTPAVYKNYIPVAVFTVNTKKRPISFVAAYEHRRYPFFALQFHPEKILYESKTHSPRLRRTKVAVRLSKLFASFILKELKEGGESINIPNKLLKRYSCPRYLFKNLMIFKEAYVYDCLNWLKKHWKRSTLNKLTTEL